MTKDILLHNAAWLASSLTKTRTYAEASALSGVDPATLSRILSGKKNSVEIDTVRQLAQACGIPPALAVVVRLDEVPE